MTTVEQTPEQFFENSPEDFDTLLPTTRFTPSSEAGEGGLEVAFYTCIGAAAVLALKLSGFLPDHIS